MKENKESSKDIVKKSSDITPFTSGFVTFEDLDRWFDDVLSHRWMRPFDWKLPSFPEKSVFPFGSEQPKVDIFDKDDEIEIQAALPGVKKEDLEVTMTNQTITIRASRKQEEKKESGDYYRREISRGEFQRTLSLPSLVDAEKGKASFKDGMLDITLPKIEKSKRKSIEIK